MHASHGCPVTQRQREDREGARDGPQIPILQPRWAFQLSQSQGPRFSVLGWVGRGSEPCRGLGDHWHPCNLSCRQLWEWASVST